MHFRKFQNSKVPKLESSKTRKFSKFLEFRSIVHGNSIYHIGGRIEGDIIGENGQIGRNVPFEEWKFDPKTDNFTITLSDTTLFDFFSYPEARVSGRAFID